MPPRLRRGPRAAEPASAARAHLKRAGVLDTVMELKPRTNTTQSFYESTMKPQPPFRQKCDVCGVLVVKYSAPRTLGDIVNLLSGEDRPVDYHIRVALAREAAATLRSWFPQYEFERCTSDTYDVFTKGTCQPAQAPGE